MSQEIAIKNYALIIFDWQGTLLQRNTPMDHVSELLIQLKNAGYTLAIASSMPLQALKQQLKLYQLTPLFSHLQTGDLGYSKPNPTMLTTVLDITGFNAEQALMLGDSSVDFEMAKSAKIDCIGIEASSEDMLRYCLKANYIKITQLAEYLLCREN
jgi:phosphoglycolate phosphatase-like HAD superfamily hydrolase